MERSLNQKLYILSLIFLCSSVVMGQDLYPGFSAKVDLSRVHQVSGVPEHEMQPDPFIEDLIDQTNLDSLIAFVRILSGEDSVWINGSKVMIHHRISSEGNDLAADYIKNKLESYKLEVSDQKYNEQGRNILAFQPGISVPETQYIICAHYDAVPNHGADDNASGVAAVLEAARILSVNGNAYTLIYALWDEEEVGLVGSRDYASQARTNNSRIQGVINLDMIGWDSDENGLMDIHSSNVASSDSLAELVALMNSIYEIGLNPVIYNPGVRASDHSSFWDNGYGAILLIEAYYGEDFSPYYHSDEDRIEKFNLPFFHKMSKLVIGSISTLAGFEDGLGVGDSPDHPSEISVYPNPADDFLIIESSLDGDYSIEIYTLSGQEVLGTQMEGGSHQIDLSSFPEGLYFITIRSKDFISTKRIILL